MAELRVECPGQSPRVFPLGARTVVVGRHESCDVQILEVKASKRHFELSPTPGSRPSAPTFVVSDLGSSNGTFVDDVRILRKEVAAGDVVRVGDTRLIVVLDSIASRTGPAAPAIDARAATVGRPLDGLVISKGLVRIPVEGVRASTSTPAVRSVVAPSSEPSPAPRGSAAPPTSVVVDAGGDTAPRGVHEEALDEPAPPTGPTPEERRARVGGRRALARGALVLAIGLGALVGVQIVLGGVADRRANERARTAAYRDLLARRDEPYAALVARYETSRREHPEPDPRSGDVARLLEAKRLATERAAGDEQELARISAARPGVDADAFGALTALLDRHRGADDPLAPRIRAAVDAAVAARAAAWGAERASVREESARLVEAHEYGRALRRWRAFDAAHAGIAASSRAETAADAASVSEAAARRADAALAEAERTADPVARRASLLAAFRELDGTPDADRVGSVLRRTSGPPSSTTGAPAGSPIPNGRPSGRPPGPSGALLSADVQAKVDAAEALARGRRFAAAASAYDALLAADASAPAKARWTDRRADLARVVGLVDELRAALDASASKSVVVPLAGGAWEVSGVDETGVRAKRGGKVDVVAWADVPARDLLVLLGRGAETPDRHLALATLAAELGERAAAVEHLAPLLDVPTHRELAFLVMATRVEGRASVPTGGYRAFEGDLLDVVDWTRRTDARRVVELRSEAEALLRKAAEDPLVDRLKAVRSKREELDRRRARALLAIFNEKHWPYPHDAPSLQTSYSIVTSECERRWKEVEEVWDDPVKASSGPSDRLDKLVARHAEVVDELRRKGVAVEPILAAMEPYALYAGTGTLTVRTYFRSKEEKALFAYDRWVIDVYNPAHVGNASPVELEQIRITNEHRMMMGFGFVVEPGPAAFENIDAANVGTVLDQGKEVSRTLLRALRIDERLLASARGHSDDMVKRGFFSHFAPPNKALGVGETSPPDRVAKAGYPGLPSENIAMSSNPMGAHQMWLHSSGHHRNILGDWDDMGMGFSGARATQNFGSGASEPVIGSEAPPDGKRKKKDR